MAFLAVGLIAASCARTPSDPDPLDLVRLTDINPDPDVVEVELVASVGTKQYRPGKTAEVWGYRDGAVDGSEVRVPGPLVEGKEGDLLIVHFRNELPESTTIHWHGPRLPQAMDGTNLAQLPVMSGETFEYRFRLEDAGSFWYHPHMRAPAQIEKGLYGPMIVHGGVQPEVSADRYFVLDDVKLDPDGRLSDETTELDLMAGRQGNVLLVNGVMDASLAVSEGARERWRFVNAANGRFFELSVPGTPFLVVGWDGGLIEEPYATDTLLIAPGERYEVLVELNSNGGALPVLQTLHYDAGHGLPDPGALDLLEFRFEGRAGLLAPLPDIWGTPESLPIDDSTVVRPFVLSAVEDAGNGMPQFYINGEYWPFNAPIDVSYRETEIWEVQNEAGMDLPFHLHGMFFQVLDRDGAPESRLGWKDTVRIARGSTVRFAVRYTAPGMWMFHSHILEHAELGMMGTLNVLPSQIPRE